MNLMSLIFLWLGASLSFKNAQGQVHINPEKAEWWQKTTVYQVYPRSFKDSDGDGIGDIEGIISKLDYIKDMGFESIWFSPFFASPQNDFGYDISDYYAAASEYGEDSDIQRLIDEVHKRDMKVIFDLVLNHTSDQHPWFLESRSSLANPKRDWYVWQDGKGKQSPPNNWKAIPGGNAWHHDPATDQWYYAGFLPFQPDLNYRNPEVRREMLKMIKHWFDAGVDGARLDVFHMLYEDESLKSNPPSTQYLPDNHTGGYFQKWIHNLHQPETISFAKEIRKLADSYSEEKVLIGEIFGEYENLNKYFGDNNDGLNLIFLWDLIGIKPQAGSFSDLIEKNEALYPWPRMPVYVYGNHDQKRMISRNKNDLDVAKILALFQYTARGVPVTYYGEEIGMEELPVHIKDALDPIGEKYEKLPQPLIDILGLYLHRDGCRSPMQWHEGKHAGFSDSFNSTWLPVHDNYETINVGAQVQEPFSLLSVYKGLTKLRNNHLPLQIGTIELIKEIELPKNVLGFKRTLGEDELIIFINFNENSAIFQIDLSDKDLLLTTSPSTLFGVNSLGIPGKAGIVIQ